MWQLYHLRLISSGSSLINVNQLKLPVLAVVEEANVLLGCHLERSEYGLGDAEEAKEESNHQRDFGNLVETLVASF